jgi:hypothetical protein
MRINEKEARLIGLTSKLSGARRRILNRSFFLLTHRLPPTINEDDAARRLQRKLDMAIDTPEPLRTIRSGKKEEETADIEYAPDRDGCDKRARPAVTHYPIGQPRRNHE